MVSDNANFLYLDDIQVGERYSVQVSAKPRTACGNCLSLLVQPNPGTAQAQISFKAQNGTAQLYITDQLGRQIAMRQISATEGTLTLAELAPGLADGIYLVRLSSAQGVVVERLILQNNQPSN